MDNLADAIQVFHEELAAKALSLEMLREHVFVEDVSEILAEAPELDSCIRTSYQGRGVKVDGYNYDEEFGTLDLVVAHWLDETDPAKLKVSDSEVERAFKRCAQFFVASLKGLHRNIEIANEAHDLANLIHECKNDIVSVKIILITDGITAKRPAARTTINGIEIVNVIWDIERILEFTESGKRETVTVDFASLVGSAIPFIRQIDVDGRYSTYLAYVSGQALADIYSLWGTRLLDMNVRVFLSARGLVNRGIRDTIAREPNLFCAYNNGITVFSRELEFGATTAGSEGISKALDFQIVNGGQTIASLYHSSKKQGADLSKVFVAMKLVIVADPDDIDVLVPKISEYSNTQNKVSLADLAANETPHPELHEISKRLQAPDPTGGSRLTHWFYEKARGSYEESKRLQARTPAKQRAFEALYPKGQKFDKGMLGKVWNTFLKRPYYVSLGAQKNFAIFNAWLKEQQEDLSGFFRKTVALVILWKKAEVIVHRQHFEGYRHNIVAYSLAWLFELTGGRIDLERIWREQDVEPSILVAIEGMCAVVNEHIRQTDRNVTEWCKREECWQSIAGRTYRLPNGIDKAFLVAGATSTQYDPRSRSEVEAIEFCKSKNPDAWFKLSAWLKEMNFLTGKARSQCYNMGRSLARGKEPSFFLSSACMKAWKESELRGWKGQGLE
jgi:hypothetical protein